VHSLCQATKTYIPACSFASLTRSKWAAAFYGYRRDQNYVHETILRSLAQKWTKILFAVWATGQATTNSCTLRDSNDTGLVSLRHPRRAPPFRKALRVLLSW
jgi:hypothetical protein